MWQIGPLQFHAYGLVVGIAVATSWLLIQRQAEQKKLQIQFDALSLWTIFAGVIGARLWHVLTDWQLYQQQPLAALFIWRGGLSIVGAVVGGLVGVAAFVKWKKVPISLLTLLDIAIFGLPAGQAIGRWANFLNQELYGLPTQLPWALYIDAEHRLPGLEQIPTYHPLFAYEMMATGLFAVGIWTYESLRKTHTGWLSVGTGHYFFSYVLYYSVVRLLLDFWRLPRPIAVIGNLGFNQVVLGLVIIGICSWLWYERTHLLKKTS